MKRRHFLTGLIAGLLIGLVISGAAIAAAGPAIKLIINGKTIDCGNTPPTIIDNRTYVPVRFVAENLGATVTWDEKSRTVLVTSGGTAASSQPSNSIR